MPAQNWVTTGAGVDMPGIIYGTAWKKERTADLVVKAIQTGFRGIDTAAQPRHYNEAQVGAALQKLKNRGINRENIFLQTKFTPISGQDPDNVPYNPDSPVEAQVAQSFQSSLNNLNTDYVDSLVLHSPVAPYSSMMKVWEKMEEIHQNGGARQLGISNCYDPAFLRVFHADVSVKPTVVQNRFYPQSGYDIELRKWSAEQGLIYQSFWTLTANPHILDDPIVRNLARQHGKTEQQIFFRYLTFIGIVPLTGTCSEQHMLEDLAIFDFELNKADIERVGQLLQ
jgi:diketogulonate reductase-like aldo/keto reductase